MIMINRWKQEGYNMIEGITLEKKEHYATLMVDIPKTRNALSVPIVE